MQEPDLLQIKIEAARGKLPPKTRQAIDAVDWKAEILRLRDAKGYSLEQLGELETETELLLCGLITPDEYPKQLEERMNISQEETKTLLEEINEGIFVKIREEMIKNSEKSTLPPAPKKPEVKQEPVKKIEKPGVIINPSPNVIENQPVVGKKISSTIWTAPSKPLAAPVPPLDKPKSYDGSQDPYREPPI